MAEEIAEKAKPGALKKVEKKAGNQENNGAKKDKNFLQNALSEAIRRRRQNLHMHDDENENEVEEDNDWD